MLNVYILYFRFNNQVNNICTVLFVLLDYSRTRMSYVVWTVYNVYVIAAFIGRPAEGDGVMIMKFGTSLYLHRISH